MKNLIIRKKRSVLRKLFENLFIYFMWLILIIILGSIILFLCHADIDNLTTMYLLLNVSDADFNRFFEWFSWLISILFLIGFFVQMNRGMQKEQENGNN